MSESAAFVGDQQARRARTEHLRERALRARAELEATSITVRSADGAVTVQVGAGGVLQSIVFGPRAESLTPPRLSASVMATYRNGCRQAAERSVEVMSSLVGPNSPTLRLMRAAVPPANPDAASTDTAGTDTAGTDTAGEDRR